MPFNEYHTPQLMHLLGLMLERFDIYVREESPGEGCNWLICTTFEPFEKQKAAVKRCVESLKSLGPQGAHASCLDFRVLLYTPEGLFACTGNGKRWDEECEAETALCAFSNIHEMPLTEADSRVIQQASENGLARPSVDLDDPDLINRA